MQKGGGPAVVLDLLNLFLHGLSHVTYPLSFLTAHLKVLRTLWSHYLLQIFCSSKFFGFSRIYLLHFKVLYWALPIEFLVLALPNTTLSAHQNL